MQRGGGGRNLFTPPPRRGEKGRTKESPPTPLMQVLETSTGNQDNAVRVICLIVAKHVVEGLAQVVRTLFDLQLLAVDLVLNVVDPLVQLGDVHLAVLKSALSSLVLLLNVEDFVLELLLPLNSLLGRKLKLLHVLADSLELLLDA